MKFIALFLAATLATATASATKATASPTKAPVQTCPNTTTTSLEKIYGSRDGKACKDSTGVDSIEKIQTFTNYETICTNPACQRVVKRVQCRIKDMQCNVMYRGVPTTLTVHDVLSPLLKNCELLRNPKCKNKDMAE
jgi:Elicitin